MTAIKEGKATLTVILDSGESHNYSFTISANSYQMGFTIDSTPRIESWISGSTVKTEETAGLQVSCEPGMDITGSPTDKSTRSYGFTYVETGKLLRFSAQGDFSQKGILNNGIMATRDNDNTPIQYETCTVSIEKVNDAGKIWFTLQFTDRSDIRIWLIRFVYGFLFHIHTICPCLLVCLSRRIRYSSCYVYSGLYLCRR